VSVSRGRNQEREFIQGCLFEAIEDFIMLWIKTFRTPANHLRDRNPHAGRRTDKITRGNEDKRQNTRGEKCEMSNEKLIN
jgi:hypothetical protein